MRFADLRLAEPLLRAVASEGYDVATPIQAAAIPHVLAGRDVLGCAQTGTGKTAAFALPILQRLAEHGAGRSPVRVRTLILCPTRELATQIHDSFRTYGKNLNLTSAVIFGGVGIVPQIQTLRRGVDVVIATPGRLLDLINQNCADLRAVEVLVLDEADRMLDMGFINDIRKIIARLPAKRQNLLFSATMPAEIRTLANSILRNPETVQVAPVAATADRIDQCVYFVERRNKPALLAHLVESVPMSRTIVFTRTKHGADRVVRQLHNSGIRSEAIHGNKSQNNRQRALANFRANKVPVLVATDIAARGIDIDGITHIVNYDLTHEPETYIHRIGRTARAGAAGSAISFCDHEELVNLKAIEKLIRRSIPVKTDQPKYTASSGASAADRAVAGISAGAAPARHPQSHPHQRAHAPRQHHAPRQQHAGRPNLPPRSHAPQAAPRPAANGSPALASPRSQGPRAAHPLRGKFQGGRPGNHSRPAGRGRHA